MPPSHSVRMVHDARRPYPNESRLNASRVADLNSGVGLIGDLSYPRALSLVAQLFLDVTRPESDPGEEERAHRGDWHRIEGRGR